MATAESVLNSLNHVEVASWFQCSRTQDHLVGLVNDSVEENGRIQTNVFYRTLLYLLRDIHDQLSIKWTQTQHLNKTSKRVPTVLLALIKLTCSRLHKSANLTTKVRFLKECTKFRKIDSVQIQLSQHLHYINSCFLGNLTLFISFSPEFSHIFCHVTAELT